MLKAAQYGNSVGAGAQYNIGRAFYQVNRCPCVADSAICVYKHSTLPTKSKVIH